MIVDRKALLNSIAKALPGVETGNVILEGADTFIFAEGFVYSYNDNISVSSKLLGEAANLNGSVKAKDFYDLINRFTDDELKIMNKEGKWIIRSGSAKAELVLLKSSTVDYIKKMIPTELEWVDLPQNFISSVKLCLFTNNHSSLSGIFILKDVILSTDEMRINYVKLTSSLKENVWLSDKSIVELIKLDGIKKYASSDRWIHFLSEDGTIFSCKKLNAKMYPFNEIMELVNSHKKEETDVEGKVPENLIFALNRASALAMDLESFSAVKLTFSPSGIIVYSERSSGKFTEHVSWDSEFKKEFEPLSIYVDSMMMEFGIAVSKSFYLKKTTIREKSSLKIVFENENGIQIVGTFEGNKG